MGLIILDGLAFFLVLGLVGVSYKIISIKYSNKLEDGRKKRKGIVNAEKHLLEAKRVCCYCNKAVDPDVDLFFKGAWWHKPCLEDVVL